VNGIGERINVRNPSQPDWKSLDRINRAGRKVQQRVQHPEHGARHQRIADADHQQKHETDHGHRSRAQHKHEIEQPHRIPQAVDARNQTADECDRRSGHQSLDRSGKNEAQNQLAFGDRRHQIAFMQAARFVVNERDAPADHGHDEDGHGNRARE
jgi:hypothetical protein